MYSESVQATSVGAEIMTCAALPLNEVYLETLCLLLPAVADLQLNFRQVEVGISRNPGDHSSLVVDPHTLRTRNQAEAERKIIFVCDSRLIGIELPAPRLGYRLGCETEAGVGDKNPNLKALVAGGIAIANGKGNRV